MQAQPLTENCILLLHTYKKNGNMRTLLTALMLILTVSGFAQKNFIDYNYIEITGKAEKEIVPDEIYIQIYINESDNKAKEPLEMLERKMLKKLEEIGIDLKKDFSVKDLNSNFKNYWLKKTDIYTSKEYQLIVNTAPKAGRVFRELEALGISNLNIVTVDHSQMETFKKELKIEAMKNSQESARALAESIGQKIGRAIYIRENEPYIPYYQPNTMMMRAESKVMDAAYQEPELEFQKIKIEYSIFVNYELQ
jgi:uncharacterized protein YggE